MKNLIFLLFFFMISDAFATVWPHSADRVWNDEWENKYSTWFEKTVDDRWLQRKDFVFFGWKVDCGELPYLARLYFSYENNLEFAVLDENRVGQKISSLNKDWDFIADPLQRLSAFAKKVLSHASTRTLPGDTYLLSIDKASIRPGVILAGDRQRAHTFVIKEIRPSGVPIFVYGTLPGSEYLYISYGFPAVTSFFSSGNLPTDQGGGFRQFRWPQDLFKPARSLYRRSLDQTIQGKVKFATFFDEVRSILQITARNENDELSYLMDDFCAKMRERVNVVIDAGQALANLDGRKFTASEEDLYSTPKRDRDIMGVIRQIDEKYEHIKYSINENNKKRYSSLLAPRWMSDDECLIPWADNRLEPLGAIRSRFIQGRISSDAHDSFARRWGE